MFFPYFYLLIFYLLGFYLLGTVFQTGLSVLLRLRLSPHALKRFTDNPDATDFIFSRI